MTVLAWIVTSVPDNRKPSWETYTTEAEAAVRYDTLVNRGLRPAWNCGPRTASGSKT